MSSIGSCQSKLGSCVFSNLCHSTPPSIHLWLTILLIHYNLIAWQVICLLMLWGMNQSIWRPWHPNNKMLSRFIWSALGDRSSSTIRSNEVSHRNFSRADLDNAAKKVYSSASARATNQQFHASLMHVLKEFQDAIVLFGCWTVKSGIIFCCSLFVVCLCESAKMCCYIPT